MKNIKLFLLIGIFVGVVVAQTTTPTPSWFKVANEGDTINTTAKHTYRFGTNTCSFNQTVQYINFLVTVSSYHSVYGLSDPCPNIVKELDVAQETAAFNVTVNNQTITVPAKAVTPVAPSITLRLTTTPIPVVINGTIKYSCSNIVLDNTGTLNLTCTQSVTIYRKGIIIPPSINVGDYGVLN